MDPHRANTKSSVELVRVTHVVVIELPNCVIMVKPLTYLRV